MEMLVVLKSEQQQLQQILAPSRNGSVVATEDEFPLPCQQVGDGDSQASVPYLPEDIWRHIHSLMPMGDAARAACISRAFLSSWRCYPKLILNCHELKADGRNLGGRVDTILRNHLGVGLRILMIHSTCASPCFSHIDSWLQLVAVKPGIEELAISLSEEYNLPCSLLSDGVRNSVRFLDLGFCTFRPMPELGPLRSLTRLTMFKVLITGEELERLLSNSVALENLDIGDCKEIVLLKIPSVLKHLKYLEVSGLCWDLQVIDNKAPNLSSFSLNVKGSKLSLGEASQMMKTFYLCRRNAVYYGRTELPSIMPNVEYLCLTSFDEVHTPPLLPTKFLNLKNLVIQICVGTLSQPYDYVSLVSFLDASPFLENWHLNVFQDHREHESVFGGSSYSRQLPEHHHSHLKSVHILGFKTAKSLIELTCCIVKSADSLERLILDTIDGRRCSGRNSNYCRGQGYHPISKAMVEEASRAVVAIRRYIEDKVAPTAKLTVLEPCPCPKCHSALEDDGRSISTN